MARHITTAWQRLGAGVPLLVATVASLWLLACHLSAPWMLEATSSLPWLVLTLVLHLTLVSLVVMVLPLIWLAVRAAWRLLRSTRRLHAVRLRPPESLLTIATGVVSPKHLFVLADQRLYALCMGLWRPAVYVSSGFLTDAPADEVRAALAHEEAHRRRRDPLRLVVTVLLARSSGRVSWERAFVERVRLRAEVAADQFARRHAPTAALARSLLRVAQPREALAETAASDDYPLRHALIHGQIIAHLATPDNAHAFQATFGERLHYLTLPTTAALPSPLPDGISPRAALVHGTWAYRLQIAWAAVSLLLLGGAALASSESLRAIVACAFPM